MATCAKCRELRKKLAAAEAELGELRDLRAERDRHVQQARTAYEKRQREWEAEAARWKGVFK